MSSNIQKNDVIMFLINYVKEMEKLCEQCHYKHLRKDNYLIGLCCEVCNYDIYSKIEVTNEMIKILKG